MTSEVSVSPITTADVRAVADFLHAHMNPRVTTSEWAAVMNPPWGSPAPNRGFQLRLRNGDIAGAYLAVYSERSGLSERPLQVCNLAAFCVLEHYRAHSLRLVRALLGQKGYEFVDLSPSGSVVSLNRRLGFEHLDTSTALVANLPRLASRTVRVTSSPEALTRTLRGEDAVIYRAHREAAAAKHLLVEQEDRHGYLVFRRDRRRGLPLFASPLHVGGTPGCLEASWSSVASHLLLRYRLPATLAEHRVLGFTPGPGIQLSNPRPKMFRGRLLRPELVDYLYSELVLVDW